MPTVVKTQTVTNTQLAVALGVLTVALGAAYAVVIGVPSVSDETVSREAHGQTCAQLADACTSLTGDIKFQSCVAFQSQCQRAVDRESAQMLRESVVGDEAVVDDATTTHDETSFPVAPDVVE